MDIRPMKTVSLVSLEIECRKNRHKRINLTKYSSRDNRDIRDNGDRHRGKMDYPLKNIT